MTLSTIKCPPISFSTLLREGGRGVGSTITSDMPVPTRIKVYKSIRYETRSTMGSFKLGYQHNITIVETIEAAVDRRNDNSRRFALRLSVFIEVMIAYTIQGKLMQRKNFKCELFTILLSISPLFIYSVYIKIKPSMVNTEVVTIMLMSKLFRAPLSYLSNIVSKNFTSQIYLDKVLVKGEAPPRLVNQVLLATVIEFVMFVICMGLLYGVNALLGLFPMMTKEVMTSYIILDFVFYMAISFSIGSIIADVMYKKKYFLYKDDGLRAIRALSELMIAITLLLTVIPFNYLMFGIISEIKRG